jgi:hypothetical protein
LRKIRRIFNLLLMELSYQYLRTNAKMWGGEFPEHPSLYRKKLEKRLEESKRGGRPWVVTGSLLDGVKLSIRERWQAWNEDGVTLTTSSDELNTKIAQWWDQQFAIRQDDRPTESK